MNGSFSNGVGQGYGVSSLNQWREPLSVRWEYQALPQMPSREENLLALNEAGAAGWELCHVGRDTYLMKRMGYRQATASTRETTT